MPSSRSNWVILSAWIFLVGGSGLVFALAPRGQGVAAFRDVLLCLVPLVANGGLLLNAASPYRRKNSFWVLIALGSTTWMASQLMWTASQLGSDPAEAHSTLRDLIFFLHPVPMLGALALQPHARKVGRAFRYGYLDMMLLGLWWAFVYMLAVVPWRAALPDETRYVESFLQMYLLETALLAGGLAWFVVRARGAWRVVYAHLLGATLLLIFGFHGLHLAAQAGRYTAGSLYDLPLVAAFVWYATAGIIAYRRAPEPEPESAKESRGGVWVTRLMTIGVLSMPFIAAWTLYMSTAPEPVRRFRVLVTLGAILGGTALVFLRQRFVDRDRLRLLRASQESVENLKRLQAQFVQSEKLASLGQLAAGAAHEINNPLTAILGYADMLMDDDAMGEKQRTIAGKLRDQALRTKNLVNNLLSFARQVPVEKTLLDLNSVVSSALQLRTLDLRSRNIRIEMDKEPALPGVRGDPNQLLQVFFNLISNAVEAMSTTSGGALTVRTRRDRAAVVIEFADTGPGIREPHLVFDPFYTTKPAGKGTGLGLSICYGIVEEHGGRISCANLPTGGAVFRIELPAVPALFPQLLAAGGKQQ